jgi:hypothetical protein
MSKDPIADIERPPSPLDSTDVYDSNRSRKTRLSLFSNKVFSLKENLNILDDPAAFQEYRSSKKSNFEILTIMPTIIILHIFFATRYNWEYIGNDGPFFLVAHVVVFVCIFIFYCHFISHCIIYGTCKEKRERLSYRMSEYILLSGFGGRIEDSICIFSTLSVGFILLAKVMKGQCESTTKIWESQRCNPVAELNSIPYDQVMILFLVPIGSQFILRGYFVVICYSDQFIVHY